MLEMNDTTESRRHVAATWFVAVCLFQGCGGNAATEVDSGLPESTPVHELSPDELVSICEANQRARVEAFSEVDPCFWRGFQMAASFPNYSEESLRDLCTEEYDHCVAMGAPMEPPPSACMPTEMANPTCEATVGQLERCWTDTIQLGERIAVAAPTECGAITHADIEEYEQLEHDKPPSCTTFENACPGGIAD